MTFFVCVPRLYLASKHVSTASIVKTEDISIFVALSLVSIKVEIIRFDQTQRERQCGDWGKIFSVHWPGVSLCHAVMSSYHVHCASINHQEDNNIIVMQSLLDTRHTLTSHDSISQAELLSWSLHLDWSLLNSSLQGIKNVWGIREKWSCVCLRITMNCYWSFIW